jgi:hypothetical protein
MLTISLVVNGKCDSFAFSIDRTHNFVMRLTPALIGVKCEGGMFEATRSAAIRVYGEMRARGHSDPRAFQAAVSLFKLHFPEMSHDDARFLVADWICKTLDP